MEQYLREKSLTTDGKKTLILIYNALRSKQTNNNIIFEYLNELKNKTLDKKQYVLKMIPFSYNGSIQRLTTFKSFITFNTIKHEKLQTIEPVSESKKYHKDDISDFLNEVEFDYESYISNADGLFIWITPNNNDDDLSYKLGLEFPKEHLISIIFPEKKYNLHHPTFIEAGDDKWFYANRNIDEKMGKTINILEVDDGKTEDELNGLNQALCVPIQLNKDMKITYIAQVIKNEEFFENKLNIFNNNIKTSYFKEDMIEEILKEYSEHI
jgi:hypothetical protein